MSRDSLWPSLKQAVCGLALLAAALPVLARESASFSIDKGWTLIDQYGLQLVGVDVGENVPRNVMLDLPSGNVDMKRGGRHA